MSLIEEALKRQQEDSGKATGASARAAAAPPPPPTVPAPGNAKGKAASRPWMAVAGVLVVVLLLVFGGLYLVFMAISQADKTLPEDQLAAPAATDSLDSESVPMADSPQAPTEPALPREEVAPGPDNTESALDLPPTETAAAEALPEPTALTDGVAPIAGNATPAKSETAMKPRKPVAWPKVVVSGVVQHNRFASAQINGRVVGLGESVDGVTLVAVENQGALLEYQGEQKFLKTRAAP